MKGSEQETHLVDALPRQTATRRGGLMGKKGDPGGTRKLKIKTEQALREYRLSHYRGGGSRKTKRSKK